MKIVTKRIELVVYTCSECPYLVYDSYYDGVQDDGYDCNKTGKRVADSGVLDKYAKTKKEYRESQKTLLPMSKEEIPPYPLSIPSWCPLEDA